MEKDQIDVFIDEEMIQEKVSQLGQRITQDYAGQEVHLLCVLKGAAIFCADLMRAIQLPLEVNFIALSSYGNETKSSGTVTFQSLLPQELRGKNIIVVEDIVDSGLTLKVLLAEIKEHLAPQSLKVAALLLKPSKLEHPIHVDYLGLKIEDKFVIGYGLDFAQKFRNLPYVGVFRGK